MTKIIKSSILLIAFFAINCMVLSAQTEAQNPEKTALKTESGQVGNYQYQVQALATARDTQITIPIIPAFPVDQGIGAIITWLIANFSMFIGLVSTLIGILEIILRVFLTKSNLSVFQKIQEFLDGIRIFRNRKSGGGSFVAKTEIKAG